MFYSVAWEIITFPRQQMFSFVFECLTGSSVSSPSVLQLRNCFGELSRVSVSAAQVVTILRGLLKATLCYLEGGQQEANGLCFCIVC